MEETDTSVFNLLTSLCEKYVSSSDKIKTVRSSCYEVLLKKKIHKDPRKFKDLEGISEPKLNLLAWCYKLTHDYDLKEPAAELERCTERLEKYYNSDINSFNNILTFMLCLKDIPKKHDNKVDLSSLPEIDDNMSHFNELFKLPPSIFGESPSTEIFNIDYQFDQTKCQKKSQSSIEIPSATVSKILGDEGYSSPEKENIWDIASKIEYSKRRCWESYGCGPPDKERPFLSELGELSSLWVENLESLYLATNLFPSFTIINNQMKQRTVFIRDIKYLLVGMPSETFNLSNQEGFFISPGIMVEGITPDAMERYCSDFIFAGACYRALNQMATPDPNTRKYKYLGYVFTEFCESLSRYLQFYRTAVISIPDTTNFLTFSEKTSQIQMQISTLASICKVGPYASETEEMPHGVALLNYLYQKVLGLSDKKLYMVLYSILYPCCQVYFSRFLHQWLLKGSLNDPYGEFFITPNLKYLSTRGRTYWTRSYGIKADIIPDFLIDLKDDILFCGRIMNLLQLCSSTNKLCMYLMGKKPLILSCCLTYDQLTQVEQNCAKYYLEASAACGRKFDFSRFLERSHKTDLSFLSLIAKKRAITLRRIELERQKLIQEQHEKKLEELLMLKEQYMTALEEKQLNIYKEIEKEIHMIQENLRIEQMREKLIEEEAAKMINYYAELCHVAERRKEQINSYIKSVSSIHIDPIMPENDHFKSAENTTQDKNSSTESFYSVPEDDKSEKAEIEVDIAESSEDNPGAVSHLENLDVLNANIDAENIPSTANIRQTINNFELARAFKQKVLGVSTGEWGSKTARDIIEPTKISNLTDAQKNKLKVLSSEFGLDIIKENMKTDQILVLTQAQKNKLKVLSSEFGIDIIKENVKADPVLTLSDAQKNKLKVLSSEFGIDIIKENVKTDQVLTLSDAQKNKLKVLSSEFGIEIIKENVKTNQILTLSEAQKNKLKVLSSEFGIDITKEDIRTDRVLTFAQVNRNKVLGHNECFTPNYGEKKLDKLDNENYVNRNLKNVQNSNAETVETKTGTDMRKSKSLMLNFEKIKTKADGDKPVPMSVDSTPMSDLPQTATPMSDFPRSTTPSSMFMSVDTKLDSFPNTADTQQTEEVFSFTSTSKSGFRPLYYNQKSQDTRSVPVFSKRVTVKEAKGISKNCLKLFLHESVSIPLLTQLKLANNEISKYFVEELNYFEHLKSLRDYFFLQDGEFGRNITENLFEKLYNANFPLDLINCRTLQHLVFSALDNSSRYQENSKHLSFKINSLPKCFDLGDPDVLDCLSLTYKVNWPLNILLPSDTVSKYDQVFKFLVKLNRVSWVLKKIFLELKILAKETGKKEIYLMSSPQYRRLHQCRHVMTHFMQTLQNYIVGEVLQPSWELFERNLVNVTNIDELYNAHTLYIKNILFRCMLNQRSVALKNIIQKIFVVILKFYDYLRSRQWICEEGSYVHPNFSKLDKIFKNFEEFVVYLFKVAKKVARSGYQPHLIQFLDILNVNDYYSKKLLGNAS